MSLESKTDTSATEGCAAAAGYAERRGQTVEWDASDGFRRCWKMEGRKDTCPARPTGIVVTREDKGHEDMLYPVCVWMGGWWLFPIETLERATHVIFKHTKELTD
jgi:hypothetical protein